MGEWEQGSANEGNRDGSLKLMRRDTLIHTCHGGVVAGFHHGHAVGEVAIHAVLLCLVVQSGDTGGAAQVHLAVDEVLRPHHELQPLTGFHHSVQGVAAVQGDDVILRGLEEGKEEAMR